MPNIKYINTVIMILIIIGLFGLLLKYAPKDIYEDDKISGAVTANILYFKGAAGSQAIYDARSQLLTTFAPDGTVTVNSLVGEVGDLNSVVLRMQQQGWEYTGAGYVEEEPSVQIEPGQTVYYEFDGAQYQSEVVSNENGVLTLRNGVVIPSNMVTTEAPPINELTQRIQDIIDTYKKFADIFNLDINEEELSNNLKDDFDQAFEALKESMADQYANMFPDTDPEETKELLNEDFDKYAKKMADKVAKKLRAQRRADNFVRMNNIFNPSLGATEIQHSLEQLISLGLGEDFTFRMNWLGTIMEIPGLKMYLSGYLVSEAWCDMSWDPSQKLIQDFPSDGGFLSGPLESQVISVKGERIENTLNPDENLNCQFTYSENGVSKTEKAHWFFKFDGDTGVKEYLGYLYKISWYINYPYTAEELENMIPYSSHGLEDDGSILFTIYLKSASHSGCSGESFKDTYNIVIGNGIIEPYDPSGLFNLSLDNPLLADAQSRYHKDFITEICIKFDKWNDPIKFDRTELCDPIKEVTLPGAPPNVPDEEEEETTPECEDSWC